MALRRLEKALVRPDEGVVGTNEGLRRTNEDLRRTHEVLLQTSDALSETNEDLRRTHEVLLQTSDALSETNEDLRQSNEALLRTNDMLSKTSEDLRQTHDVLVRTREDFRPTSEVLFRTNEGLLQSNSDLFRTEDETEEPTREEVPMSATKSVHRSLVSLALPNKVPALISFALSVVTAMTGNTSFPAPAPTLAALTAAITVLQTAQAAALARTKGAVTARNDKKAALVALLQELKAYIQKIADADPENSSALIQSAAVSVKKTGVRKPRVFSAVQGAVSGTAKLVTASAGHRSSYEWQSSVDGGKTWVEVTSTLQAKASVTGLPPGATAQFRYRATTKAGLGDWSPAISLLVK
jgi:hypothetical protein